MRATLKAMLDVPCFTDSDHFRAHCLKKKNGPNLCHYVTVGSQTLTEDEGAWVWLQGCQLGIQKGGGHEMTTFCFPFLSSPLQLLSVRLQQNLHMAQRAFLLADVFQRFLQYFHKFT